MFCSICDVCTHSVHVMSVRTVCACDVCTHSVCISLNFEE